MSEIVKRRGADDDKPKAVKGGPSAHDEVATVAAAGQKRTVSQLTTPREAMKPLGATPVHRPVQFRNVPVDVNAFDDHTIVVLVGDGSVADFQRTVPELLATIDDEDKVDWPDKPVAEKKVLLRLQIRAEAAEQQRDAAEQQRDAAEQQRDAAERDSLIHAAGGLTPADLSTREAISNGAWFSGCFCTDSACPACKSGDFLKAVRIIASAPGVRAKMETEWGTYTRGDLGRFVNFELGEKSIAREKQLEDIRTYLSDPITGHGKFLATWAAPGSGKSHVMAEVARNVSEEQWKGSDGRKLVPLLVSFSSGVVYELRGLVVRLVATYLCGVVEMWNHTANAVDRCLPADFSVEDFSAVVRAGGGMPVFLIDEISKAVKRDGLEPLTESGILTIHEMRKKLCMQLGPWKGGAKMLVTSLDSIVARYEPGSRAARVWFDLPAIPVAKLEDSDEVTNACKKHRLVKPFLTLCGGHPRSIGAMVRAILPVNVNITRGLLERLGAQTAGVIGNWFDRDVVAPVLLSTQFTLDSATLDRSPRARAVENALGRGVLVGTVANDAEKTTPAMSFFALRKWLDELTHDAVWTKSRVDRMRLWMALEVGDNVGAGGCGFESLHAHAMAIRSVARAIVRATDGGSDVLPLFGDKAVFAGVNVLHGSGAAISDVRCVERTGVFKLSHNLISRGAKVHAGAWVCEGDEHVVDTLDATTVFAPGDTNAGFDFVELYARADGGKHLVLTECKYSDWDASTTFGIGDAIGKMASVDTFLKATLADKSSPIVKAGIERAQQVTLVFAVFRDSTGVIANDIKTEAITKKYEFGVAHASKEQLSALYGKTLVPLFNFQSVVSTAAQQIDQSEPSF